MTPSSETILGNEKQPPDEQDPPDRGESRTEQDRPSEQRPLPKDVLFGILSAKRRRYVLEYMAENGPETTLSDLADHIAAKENDTEIRWINSKQRKRVYVSLYQSHLPRMDDADIIEFEHARGTVEIRPNATQMYQYMDVSQNDSDGADAQKEHSITGRVSAARTRIEGWIPKLA